MLGKVFLQERDAPSAAGSSASAFAQLAGATDRPIAQVVDNLPLGDVKAVADCVVKFHVVIEPSICRSTRLDVGRWGPRVDANTVVLLRIAQPSFFKNGSQDATHSCRAEPNRNWCLQSFI